MRFQRPCHTTNNSILTTVLGSSASAAIATTAAIAACGQHEDASGWAPLNAVRGDETALHATPSWKYSATGIGLNAAAMLLWGAVYACLARRDSTRSTPRALAAGLTTAATAYVVDYHVVPERLTPGFEKRLSGGSMFVIFGSFATGLAVGDLLTQATTGMAKRSQSSTCFPKTDG
jgi:hypothetical protein